MRIVNNLLEVRILVKLRLLGLLGALIVLQIVLIRFEVIRLPNVGIGSLRVSVLFSVHLPLTLSESAAVTLINLEIFIQRLQVVVLFAQGFRFPIHKLSQIVFFSHPSVGVSSQHAFLLPLLTLSLVGKKQIINGMPCIELYVDEFFKLDHLIFVSGPLHEELFRGRVDLLVDFTLAIRVYFLLLFDVLQLLSPVHLLWSTD